LSPVAATPLLAVGSLLLGATLWGVMWYPLRLLEGLGVVGLWSSLLIYLGALLVTPWIIRGKRRPVAADVPWLIALLVLGGWCSIAFMLAVIHGEVLRVMLLFYLSPVWVLLLGRVVLGELLTPRALGVTTLALSGAMVMLWDPVIGLPWPHDGNDWLALSAGVGFASANIVVRKTHGISLQYKTIPVWIGAVGVAVVMLLWEAPPVPDNIAGIGGALLLGILGMTVMTTSVQYGVTHMPVQRSSVIMLFEVLAGAVSAWWLAGELLDMRDWIGGALIVAGAWLAAWPR